LFSFTDHVTTAATEEN